MSLHSFMRSLDAVATHLSFSVDDFEQVNGTFTRWHQHRGPDDKQTVDVWTYCYVCRYFLVQFLRSHHPNRADFDLLVEKTLSKIARKTETLRQPERYAAWVSVICKHTFINYIRSRRSIVADDLTDLPADDGPTPGEVHDKSVAYQTILGAINRLPDFLRDIARMRFLEDDSYEHISQVSGKPIPTVRSYVNKILNRLRADPAVEALLAEHEMSG